MRPDQIDEAIRASLSTLNSERTNALVEKVGDGVERGLAATDLADIARAAVAGAVSTLVYDFTDTTVGRLNDGTGQVTFGEAVTTCCPVSR